MAANAFRNESDEAFARRLQAQEMGLPNSNTPLIVGVTNANLIKLTLIKFLLTSFDRQDKIKIKIKISTNILLLLMLDKMKV